MHSLFVAIPWPSWSPHTSEQHQSLFVWAKWKETIITGLVLGKDPATKSDDFLEKFQTAFDPPLIFGKLYCKFFVMDMIAYMQGGMRAR